MIWTSFLSALAALGSSSDLVRTCLSVNLRHTRQPTSSCCWLLCAEVSTQWPSSVGGVSRWRVVSLSRKLPRKLPMDLHWWNVEIRCN